MPLTPVHHHSNSFRIFSKFDGTQTNFVLFADSRTDTDGAAGGDGTLDMGSRSSLHTGLHMSEDEHWEMNYHEAAIYLEV